MVSGACYHLRKENHLINSKAYSDPFPGWLRRSYAEELLSKYLINWSRLVDGVNPAMKKLIYNFLKKFVEKNYHIWGIKLEVDLPPEFIITEHAVEKIQTRFNCRPDKMYKVMLKAWKSNEVIDPQFIARKRSLHEKGIYKSFNGFIFVFRTRYNKKSGCAQKYLVTVFKKSGFQLYT